MKNVLVIGSTGQIGSELTMKLRGIYGGNIVAGYIPGQEPKGELLESGPSAIVDITNEQQIAETVSKYKVDTIYNLAALLSAVAEAKPQLAWKIGMGGLFNVLEVAREMHCAVFTPSSIGVFGNNTPKDKTPQGHRICTNNWKPLSPTISRPKIRSCTLHVSMPTAVCSNRCSLKKMRSSPML